MESLNQSVAYSFAELMNAYLDNYQSADGSYNPDIDRIMNINTVDHPNKLFKST